MNFSDISAFLAIVETTSISKAAEKLFVSQSTISNRLNNLETEIEDTLINRSQGIKGISLTPRGEEFLSFARRYQSLVKDYEEWKSSSSRYKLKVAGPMSINCYTLRNLYVDIVNGDYPLVLIPTSHWNFTIFSLMESSDLDIGIVSIPYSSKNLITNPIFSENYVMISDPKFSNYADVIDAQDLNVENEIFFDWGTEYDSWHNQIWSPMIHPKVAVDSPSLIEYFLASTDTWAILPESVAYELCRERDLKISTVTPSLPDRVVYMITQRNPNPSGIRAMEIFKNLLLEYISNNKYLVSIKQ